MDPASLIHGLTFCVATASELPAVLALRRTIYVEALGHEGLDELDTAADHLFARDEDGVIVAAFRLLGPDQRPFPIEEFVDLETLLAPGRCAAYLDRFVIRPGERNVSRRHFIPIGMLKFAITRARQRAITDFFILSLTHLRKMYRSAFFRPCAGASRHVTWGEVYPMRLDIVALEAMLAASDRPLVRFLLDGNLNIRARHAE